LIRASIASTTNGWRAQVNLTSTREPMAATGTGPTVIDVRPAVAAENPELVTSGPYRFVRQMLIPFLL
jgi:hypothetical protein